MAKATQTVSLLKGKGKWLNLALAFTMMVAITRREKKEEKHKTAGRTLQGAGEK